MNRKIWSEILRLARADFCSPCGLLVRAGVIAVIVLALHVAGLRDYTSVLNGTVGSTAAGWKTSVFLGVAYLLFYMAFVVVAPMFILAAAILASWRKACD
jgi:hypothetical protein